jgi:hypothetical protein
MKNSCLIIPTKNEGFIVTPVKYFAKEEMIEAIGKALSIDRQNIDYLSGSMSASIFGIKELYPKSYDNLRVDNCLEDERYFNVIHVKHGKFAL